MTEIRPERQRLKKEKEEATLAHHRRVAEVQNHKPDKSDASPSPIPIPISINIPSPIREDCTRDSVSAIPTMTRRGVRSKERFLNLFLSLQISLSQSITGFSSRYPNRSTMRFSSLYPTINLSSDSHLFITINHQIHISLSQSTNQWWEEINQDLANRFTMQWRQPCHQVGNKKLENYYFSFHETLRHE